MLMYSVYTPLFRPFPPRLEAPTFGALHPLITFFNSLLKADRRAH